MKKYIKAVLALAILLGAIAAYRDRAPVPSSVQVEAPASVEAQRAPAAAAKQPKVVAASSARRPSSSDGLALLTRASEAEWRVSRGRGGQVTRLSGGVLPLESGAPVVSAAAFLAQYSQSLFGVPASDLAVGEARQDQMLSQVVVEQSHAGLPVYGSRLNLFFNRDGALVHATAALHPGPFPAASPSVSKGVAAGLLRDALWRFLDQRGDHYDRGAYDATALEPFLALAYRLAGERVSLVYRARFSLAAPLTGDMEALIDAQSGVVVVLRPLDRR